MRRCSGTVAVVDVALWRQFGVVTSQKCSPDVGEAPIVDPGPWLYTSLFLVETEDELGDDEPARGRDDTGRDVTVRRFSREEGDAHCQVTNLELAHLVVFDWLDRRFNNSSSGPHR